MACEIVEAVSGIEALSRRRLGVEMGSSGCLGQSSKAGAGWSRLEQARASNGLKEGGERGSSVSIIHTYVCTSFMDSFTHTVIHTLGLCSKNALEYARVT